MSTLKLIGCVAIIIGCFAVLYPRFMHPLVLRLFGLHKGKVEKDQPVYPPGYGRPGMQKPRPEDVTRTGGPPQPGDPKPMRPGPHPGMRAASEMNRQQAQGSGRGMMGVVLPMYAVGIIVYLIYTLVKVFNKRSDSQSRYPSWNQEGRPVFGMNEPPDGQPAQQPAQQTDLQKLMSGASPGKDLEELLLRADDPNVSAAEMRELQRRLEETEAQMHRILAAMQNVHQKVSTVIQPDTAPGTEPASPTACPGTQQAAQTEKQSTADQVPETPDTESYEVIKNASSSSDASPLTELPDLSGTAIETITAACTNTVSAKTSGVGEEETAKDEVEDVVLIDKTKEEEEEDGEVNVRQRKPIPVE